MRSPLRAAELPFTTEHTFPFLMTKPRWPVLSLCVVMVRWKGLAGRGPREWAWDTAGDTQKTPPHGPAAHLSRTIMMIFSADAFFTARWALSLLHPAQSRPSICRI